MPLHAIIDLETLSKEPDAIITQMAIVLFEPHTWEIIARISWLISTDRQESQGRSIDLDTIAFHIRQGNPVHQPHSKIGYTDLTVALGELREIITTHIPSIIWIWGSDFDSPMLKDAFYHFCMGSVPWHYAAVSDARTIWKLAFGEQRHPQRRHDALQDCYDSIRDMKAACEKLGIPLTPIPG